LGAKDGRDLLPGNFGSVHEIVVIPGFGAAARVVPIRMIQNSNVRKTRCCVFAAWPGDKKKASSRKCNEAFERPAKESRSGPQLSGLSVRQQCDPDNLVSDGAI